MPDTEPQGPSRAVPPPSGPRRRPTGGADAAKIVRRYLSALDSSKPGRSVRRTAEAVANRILKIDELVVSADPLTRLHLTQERIDLHAEHVRLTTTPEVKLAEMEGDFVRVARSYSERHGITYAAWRQIGVDADVLERAGIHRTRPALRPDRPGVGGAPVGRRPQIGDTAPSSRAVSLVEDAFADVDADAAPEVLPLGTAVDAVGEPPADVGDAEAGAEAGSDAGSGGGSDAGSEAGRAESSTKDEVVRDMGRNGLRSHDSPPMRRRRLSDAAPGE